MAMTFPAQVERWRPTVAKYFPADLVDKALWVIQWESGGNPGAVGDGGAARGLFQIQDSRNFASRPDAAYLDNPENNIRYAAQQLGAASGRWSDWGEGTTYNGQVFGALGNHPFQGAAGTQGGSMVAGVEIPQLPFSADEYLKKQARYNTLNVILYNPNTGKPNDPNDPLWNEWATIKAELEAYVTARANYGQDWGTVLDVNDYNTANDPRNIAADNAANKFAREFNVNKLASDATGAEMTEQRQSQNDAETSFNNFLSTPAYAKGAFRVPSMSLPDKDEMFRKNLDRVRAGLPDVPDRVGGGPLDLPPLPSDVQQGPQQGPRRPLPNPFNPGSLAGRATTPAPVGGRSMGGTWAEEIGPQLPPLNGYDRIAGGGIGAVAKRRGINGSILNIMKNRLGF